MYTLRTGIAFLFLIINIYFGQSQLLSVVQHETSAYHDAIIRVNAVAGSTVTNRFSFNGTAQGGSGSITPGGSTLVSGLAPGNYTFQISSDLGLTSESISIVPYCNFPLFNNNVFLYQCNDAQFNLTVPITGITAPVTFYWKTPISEYSSNSAVTFGPPGTYEVTVVDAVGCIESDAITIHSLDPIIISCSSLPSSQGQNDGSIQLTFSGGQAPYDVEIYGPVFKYYHYTREGTYLIPNLPPGSYEIYVYQVDYLLCDDPCEVEILEETCNLNLSNQQITHIKCKGANNGSITLSPSNGTAPYQFQWSNGRTSSTISNLSAGDYVVTVTDVQACSSTSVINILEPAALNLAVNRIAQPTCAGNDGMLSIRPLGGTTPYRYAWSNGATTSSLSNLSGGTYTLTVTDANQCTTTGTWELLNATLPPFTSTVTPIPCLGGRGAITLNLSTSTQALWQDGSTLKNRDQLLPGTYHVTISAGGACIEELEFVLAEPPLLAIQCALVSHQTTQSGKEGQIDVTVRGGTPPYRLSLTGPKVLSPNLNFNTQYSFKDLSAGTYTLSATDSRGCIASCGTIIIEARLCTLSLNTVTTTEVSCFGANDGVVTVSATGSGTLTYTLTGPGGYNQQQNQSTFTGLAPGNYNLTVKDPAGCTVTGTARIIEPQVLALTCSQVPLSHVDSTNASINIAWSGGLAPYTLIWNGGADQSLPMAGQLTLSELPADSFQLTIQDNRGCQTTCSQIIGEITCAVSAELQAQVGCAGLNAGQLRLDVQSALAPLTFAWRGPRTLQGGGPFTDLVDGSYAVTIIDRQGCTSTANASLESWPLPDVTCAVISHQRTLNGQEGTLVVEGQAGHTVLITNIAGFSPRTIPSTNGQVLIEQLQPGSYDLLVTSTQGCTTSCTQVIEPKICTIAAITRAKHLSCADVSDGALTLQISGAVQPEINVTGPGGRRWTASVLNGLSRGTYFYQVGDGEGCIVEGAVELTAPSPLLVAKTVQEPTDSLNPNGIIALTPSGGSSPYQVLWSHGGNGLFQSKLSVGTYKYTITDQNGCQLRDSIMLQLTGAARCASLIIQAQVTPASCSQARDGSIALILNGGENPYDLLWSSGQTSTSLSLLAAGKYTVTVTDQAGCLALSEVEITAPPAPTLSEEYTLCKGSSVVVQGQLLSAVGTYTLTRPGRLCDTTLLVTVKAPPQLELISAEKAPGDFCGATNRIRFINAPEGTTFSLDGGQSWSSGPNYDHLTDGTYVLQASSDGCILDLGSLELVANGFKEIIKADIRSPRTCRELYGSIDLTIADAEGWEWQLNDSPWQPEAYFDTLLPGDYQLRGRVQASTCIQTFAQVLTIDSVPPTDIAIKEEVIQLSCPGGASGLAQLSISGGAGAYAVRWDQGQLGPILSAVPAGHYAVTVTDEEGCQAYHKVTIGEEAILAPLEDTSIILCPGDLIKLHLDTSYTYQWRGPESFTYLGPNPEMFLEGTYQVNFIDHKGCTDERTVELVPSKKAFLVNFLVPALALTGTEIKAVENSWPIPDSISWWVEEGIDIVASANNTLSFSGAGVGDFIVGLRSYYQGCLLELTKTVRFTDDPAQAVIDPSTAQTTIKSLTIAPNPNSGQFTLRIELNKPLGLQLRIYDPAGQLAMSKYLSQSSSTSLNEEIVLDQPVSGIYSLSLQSPSEWRTWSFIVLR